MGKRRKKSGTRTTKVSNYRHDQATRKNNPPAKIAAEGTVPAMPKVEYAYSPRRPPVLRFDQHGGADALPELLAAARRRPLTDDEAKLLAEALRQHEPWLEWAGKREAKSFEVDPVALHIHERISAQAILKVAARQDVQRSLFADPELAYHEAVQFYRHDIDWTNRMILGDSLQVMSSLARREDLAGKVQMIYIDPPYGIKFASNFQPEIGRRDVKDKEADLTREPEMVKAYRDTWHLGIHSYLSYLRDRLIVARELHADTGSIFVQIGDENVHLVRQLMDTLLGNAQAVAQISFRKTGAMSAKLLDATNDYLLWYAKDIERIKYRELYKFKELGGVGASEYVQACLPDGTERRMTSSEVGDLALLPEGSKPFTLTSVVSDGAAASSQEFFFNGKMYRPGRNEHWKTTLDGMQRLACAGRLSGTTTKRMYRRYFDDFPVYTIDNNWQDVRGALGKAYVVQTAPVVIDRCMLMTTDPGDLVLDPTCGSGTTAYVAEQWGRRWITIDTSRVSIAIARQRLLTSRFERYRVDGEDENGNGNGDFRPGVDPHPGFCCKKVPHVTLGSIARNTNLDPIFARHEPILDEKLAACNAGLGEVTAELRRDLEARLAAKQRKEGKKAITDADRRRWELPKVPDQSSAPGRRRASDQNRDREGAANAPAERSARKSARRPLADGRGSDEDGGKPLPHGRGSDRTGGFEHWTVPFDTDPHWPRALQDAVTSYREAWRAKMDEVNACIAANAGSETLVDRPEVVKGVVRVSGPFTVEAVQPPELSLGDNVDPHTGGAGFQPVGHGQDARATGEGLFDGEPEGLPDGFDARELRVVESRPDMDTQNVEAYLDKMLRYLKVDGVRFPNNKQMRFTRLQRLSTSEPGLQAEGRWVLEGKEDDDPEGQATVGVAFGPQYGPVTAKMVEGLVRSVNRLGYDDLVIAAFSFDGPAQMVIEEAQHPSLRIHAAHIRPDVNPAMDGLLKEQPGSQLFTVFGQPRTRVDGPDGDGQYRVTMEGVDIYDPVNNSIASTGAEKVAAWFLDGDYDGRTFCVTQAFFPDRSAWDKLAKALKDVVNADAFAAFSGTVSLPFPSGKHKRVAVKVIDPRGNEVMRVHKLA